MTIRSTALAVAAALAPVLLTLSVPPAGAAEHGPPMHTNPSGVHHMGQTPGQPPAQGAGMPGTRPMMGMPMMGMTQGTPGMASGMPAGDDGPSSLAYQGVNNKMHRDMAITYSGDPDVDFAKGMIPHHQGAIDAAKIAIAFGSDPEIRKLAEGIIQAQESEIASLREWLQKKGQ